MTTSEEFQVKQRVLARFDKDQDVETHVRLVEVGGVSVVAISDWIVSLETYGRSYWLPRDESALRLVAQALNNITDQTRV